MTTIVWCLSEYEIINLGDLSETSKLLNLFLKEKNGIYENDIYEKFTATPWQEHEK